MKTTTLFILLFLCARWGFGQSSKTIEHRFNIVGWGYGIEVIASSHISFTGEIGLSPWERLGDKLIKDKDERDYEGMARINPYANISARYYLKALSEQDRLSGKSNTRWYASVAYSGLYTGKEFLKLDGTGRHQVGAFVGVKATFLKCCYFEIDLGPAYQQTDWGDDGVSLFGNGGLGFYF